MPEPLTKRQREAWDALKQYERQHGVFPTYDELGAILGCKRQTAHYLVACLEERRWLRTYINRARAVRILTNG